MKSERHLEKEVEELRALLKVANELVRAAPTFVGILTPDGRVVEVNDAATQAINATHDDISGKLFWDCPWWSTNTLSSALVRRATGRAAEGHASNFDVAWNPPDGGTRYLQLIITPYYDDHDALFRIGVSGTDVTHRKLEALQQTRDVASATASLKRSEASLERMEQNLEAKEQFVSYLSHDLRSPLTAILMSAASLRRRTEDGAILRIADRIHHAATRADQMIQQLLESRRIGSHDPLLLEFQDACLVSALKNVLRDLIQRHGERFVMDCPDQILGYWDTGAIERAIENVCSNAVKYGDSDTPIRLSVAGDDNQVRISVTNQGNPISRADQKRLFMPFYRSSSATGGAEKGWGIGLAYVWQVARLHNGRMEVQSSEEEGTTFTLILPRDVRGELLQGSERQT